MIINEIWVKTMSMEYGSTKLYLSKKKTKYTEENKRQNLGNVKKMNRGKI